MSIYKTLILFLFIATASLNMGAQEITTQQWQEDLNYLDELVKKSYSFLFKKVEESTWDSEVVRFRARLSGRQESLPQLEEHEIKVGFSRLISLFEYGHTQVPFSAVADYGVLPVNLYQFKDGIYVEGVRTQDQSIVGAEVLAIMDVPVEQALERIRPVVPVENEQYFKAYGLRFLTVPAVLHAQGLTEELLATIDLTLEKDGETFHYALPTVDRKTLSVDYSLTVPNENWVSARKQEETPLYLKHLQDKLYYFEYLPESKTVYVRQSSVFDDEEETLAQFYQRLFAFIDANEVEKLIYDCRLNGGGNNYNNKPLVQGLMARPELNQQGKLFYITGRRTFSAAQNLTNVIEYWTEAILVGEPTAENVNFYGDTKEVTLPNSGLKMYLSYAWWQDRPQWENAEYTIPNLAVAMSFDDYVNNKDVVLQAAMDYTDDGFILRPLEHLQQLFMQGKMEQLQKDAMMIAQDPRYEYFDFEGEFIKAATRLLQTPQPEIGLQVMQLVVSTFPESTNAWYNMASAQEQLGQTEGAIKSYQKVLTLNPSSTMESTIKTRLATLQRN
ncbi:tetratricopeptide repeat protein [Croceiramulus getboli]|nr:tetratricopeptide repeat protein [Flavobacteriaceae bacterium YJPT1-3]